MKYAIISDIHGNAPALHFALEDARRHGAEGFLFVGDYCISSPWANDVVSLIQTLPDVKAVSGNDEAHLDVPPGDDGQYEVSRWCAGQLTPAARAFCDALPQHLSFTCEGVAIHMAHASSAFIGDAELSRFSTRMLPAHFPTHRPERAEYLAYIRSALAGDEELQHHLAAMPKGIYIFGHTHSQWYANFGGRWLINPGSCGLPLDCGDFGAAYTLLTIRDGDVQVEERRIPYDAEALIDHVRRTEQYRAAYVWSEAIFSEWRTCREKVCFILQHAENYARSIGDERRPFARDTWRAAFDAWQASAPLTNPELFIP